MLKTLKLALTALALTMSLAASEAVAAPERHIAIVLDRSGSMTARRTTENRTRFEAAKSAASDILTTLAGTNNYVSIWTFEGTGFIQEQYFTNNIPLAKNKLMGLPVGTGLTPLAFTLCSVADSLRGFPPQTAGNPTFKELLLFSDGEENNSPAGSQCAGPDAPATESFPNYTPGTWQAKVTAKLRPIAGVQSIVVHARVFTDYFTLTGNGSSIPERDANGSLVQPSATALPSSYYAFLASLVQSTGGSMTLVRDAEPAPRTIAGDTNRDFCVNNTDYNLVMANYGLAVPPGHPDADLNYDKVVDYDDYNLVMSNFGTGPGCGVIMHLSED
jgi:hypothetical protein